MRTDIIERKEEILLWISQQLPNAEIARKLHCRVDTLKNYYSKLGIDYRGNPLKKNLTHNSQKKPVFEYLRGNASNSSKRKRLIEEGLKEAKCEICGLSEWQGKLIPLELHHKDFNHYNNDISNLQILCSNCHMQAHNYNNSFKNSNDLNLSAQEETLEVEPCKFEETLTDNADGNFEPNSSKAMCVETRRREPKSKPKKFCAYCGKELLGKEYRNKYCSQECAHADKKKRPNVFELLEDFKLLKSFIKVGEKYGVSDNAVRKWCILYNILDMVKAQSRPQTNYG